MRKAVICLVVLATSSGLALGEPPGGTLHLRELLAAGYEAPSTIASPAGVIDCNGNGIPDDEDIQQGTSPDCNSNGIPDECDTEPQFDTHIVSIIADGIQEVVAADLDGDGDLDLVAALADDDDFGWYENLDGAGTFGMRIQIDPDADFAVSVFPADIDDDGDLDLLTAAAFADTIAWYENTDGAASVGPPRVITTTALQAWSVFAADIDGDSDLDAVSASQIDNKIAWYENTDGLGDFGPQQVISTLADIPVSVHVADADGDGDLDVFSASDGDDKIAWYENSDGLGSFGHQQVITMAADDASSVRAADLDGDGDLDVLSASFVDNKIAWYEKLDDQDGYGPQQLISTNASLALSVFARDLDGDGDLDVLSASGGDNKIAWYENSDGLGDFGPEQVITTDAGGAGWVYAADIDGDGDADVISGSDGNNRIAWYENLADDCDGNTVPDACEPDCNSNGRTDACDVGSGSSFDCNANDVPDECDIVSGAADCTGNGIPDECEPDCNGNETADSCDIDGGAADCTGNGIPDECEPDCNTNGTADICEIDSGTSFDCDGNAVPDECDITGGAADCDTDGVLDRCETRTLFTPHPITASADFARSVFAADMDGDGDPDALSASFSDDKIAWYENSDGQGTFGAQQVISQAANGAFSVHAADLTGDLAVDVQSASFNDNEIAWYENRDPAGSFEPQQVISTSGISAASVVAADVDGDGDRDVLAASFDDDEIAWYENIDGRGAFGEQRLISTLADGAIAVFAADVDGDGDVDALSASLGDGKIAWYENADAAGGSWNERPIATVIGGVSSIFAADVDGDGDLDILSASQDDDRVSWHENTDGLGTFGPRQVVSLSANGASAVAGADLNGDGKTDVLSASFFDSRVAWYENLGGASGFAEPRVISAVVTGARAVFATDLDGDGDVDVLSASQDDDEITWYENESGDCNGNGSPDGCDVDFGTSADCSGNGVPDECEPDCNGNGVADSCDVVLGTSTDCNLDGFPDDCQPSRDCNANGVPDACDSGCADCDADGDGCLDGADADPQNLTVCGDSDLDSCEDCSGTFFDPSNDGPDFDGDGACNNGDCVAFDGAVWREPGTVTDLMFFDETPAPLLRWSAPVDRGSVHLRYDLLRSSEAYDFVVASTCLESDDSDRAAADGAVPAPGGLFHYLVRVENDCPGAGNMGRDSLGFPRSGLSCP